MDHLNGILPGEKFSVVLALQRLSESGICLLSGQTENLTVIPVDFDLSNYLASNVAQVTKEVAVEHHQRTFNYELPFKEFKVEFESSNMFVGYNKDVLEMLSTDLSIPVDCDPNAIGSDSEKSLYAVWEWLTNKHIKGIQRIKLGTDILNRYSYQNWVFRELERRKETRLHLLK